MMNALQNYFVLYLLVVFSGSDVTTLDSDRGLRNAAVNTGLLSAGNAEFYKSTVSLTRLSSSPNKLTDLLKTKLDPTKDIKQNTETEIYIPDLSQWDYNDRSRIITESLHANHPLRQKRDITCAIPKQTLIDLTPLYALLNKTTYFGRNIKQPPVFVPRGQKKNCPDNFYYIFNPICPSFQVNQHLGYRAVPSWVTITKCRCDNCLTYPRMKCQSVVLNVTYYEHIRCFNGLAIMSPKVMPLSMGCVCGKPYSRSG